MLGLALSLKVIFLVRTENEMIRLKPCVFHVCGSPFPSHRIKSGFFTLLCKALHVLTPVNLSELAPSLCTQDTGFTSGF